MALPELLGSLTSTQIWGFGVFFFVASFVVDFFSYPRYPEQIPMVGKGRGAWNMLLDSFLYIPRSYHWISDGYTKYGKKDLPFIAPTPLSRPPDVVMPRSQIPWLMDQPDNVVSTLHAHNAILYSEYNFLGRRLAYDGFPHRVMQKALPRHVSTILADIEDEMDHSVDQCLGDDTENWKSVNIWGMWLEIVPHVTNRMLVGPKFCRDKKFVNGMVSFAEDVIRNNFLLEVIPKVLHPIFGRLVTIPNYLHWRSASSRILPMIKERLDSMTKRASGDSEFKDYVPPEDFITWAIRAAIAEGSTFELDPVILSKRILPIQFAAIHTTVLTGLLWMVDLLSTDPETGILDTLRQEIHAHKPKSGPWSKAALANLIRIDSSIRESQRFSNFATTLIERMVVAENGLHNPELGWTLPKGSFMTVNLQGTHHDEELYENPDEYDALRYSRAREAWDAMSDEEKQSNPDEGTRIRGLGMVTTSPRHLAFGHGRHSCPGRFFVSYELKLFLVNLLLNYDVRLVGKRPEKKWLGSSLIPPLKQTMEVRRRKTNV